MIRTKIILIFFAFVLISCSRVYSDQFVEIKKQYRGKSVLQGSYIIKTKKEIPANFPKIEVDFGKSMIIGVFLGGNASSPTIDQTIEIINIVEKKQEIIVYVNYLLAKTFYKVYFDPPKPDDYHIVEIKHSDKRIIFKENIQYGE